MAMATVSFDTLRFSRKLQDAGFSPEQAVGEAEAFADASGETLATKTDIGNAVSQLRVDMREMELRMTLRMGVMLGAAIGILVALDKLI